MTGGETVTPTLSAKMSRALDAMLALAEANEQRTVSVRELARRLGVQTSTAAWYRDRLVRDGYIRLVPRGRREAPAVWATRQRRPDVPFGECPVCGLERALDSDGLLPHHDRGREGSRTCDGVGQPPRAVA